jgi:RsiW-degrading membrane proteinase PrsW (M82 family)
MGYYYGVAHRYKYLGQDSSARTNRLLALIVPALIHGLYDFALSVEDAQTSLAGLVFTFAIFVLAVRRTRLSAEQDEAFWGGYQQ